MRSLGFNISGTNQHAVVENRHGVLNPPDCLTVEAMCEMLEDGQDPTIFSLPAGEKWEPPFVAWRLGFSGRERLPEFQVTIQGEAAPTTARSQKPIVLHEKVHLAGTFDGNAVRLYVNGELMAEVAKPGVLLQSNQKAAMAARSTTDLGGLLVGRLFEVRFWRIALPVAEIDAWKDKSLPLPAPEELVSLWKVEPSLDLQQANQLVAQGFSRVEIALATFVTGYAHAYSLFARELLTGVIKEQFGYEIHAILIGRGADGYIVLYEPSPPELLRGIGASSEEIKLGGFFGYDWSKYTLSDILQMVSGNGVKIGSWKEGDADKIELPKDCDNAVPESVNPRLRAAGIAPPQIHIIGKSSSEGKLLPQRGRIRINSPLVTIENGDTVRAYPWLFADIWLGELTWDIAQKGLSDQLAINDLLDLKQFAMIAQPPAPKVVEVMAEKPLLPLETIITEFESLIGRDDVDEVRDVLPFLGKTEHWVLLSPAAQHVWPEKMLGNKYRVDFVLRESDATYVAIEVESPKKRLYKTGDAVDPYAEWTHAEQQVRDYCNFIDANRDYVEREEGLIGILKPKGLVIIGRRDCLAVEGKRKLAERNADNGRYRTITYDELLDQAKGMVKRLRAIISPSIP